MKNSTLTNLYQHFRRDEYLFIDRVSEWKRRVEETYLPFVTPFLNPREQFIMTTLFSKDELIKCYFEGGFETSERKKALITIAQHIIREDFEYDLLNIRYPQKFAQLKHHHILGSLLGCGIKREQIGDIITNGTQWQVVVAKQISHYIKDNCKKVGAISVVFETIDLANPIVPLEHYTTINTTVSSLRLDVLLASAFHLSRQKVKELIESGLVSVNWREETKGHMELSTADTVSLRHHGRLNIQTVQGVSKQGKIKIQLRVLNNKK